MCCIKSFKFSILFGLIFFPSWVFSIPPTAEGYVIGPKEGHAPFTVQLSAIEFDGISSYIWMASNGLNALNSTTEMTFETPGSYDISLEVVDTEGMRSSSPVATIIVKSDVPPLEAFFDIVILGKEGEKEDGSSFTISKITFSGDENVFVNKPLDEPLLKIGLVSRSTGQNIINYDWTINCNGDDISYFAGSKPTIPIDVTGYCNITLIITDNDGNTSEKTRGIAIGEVCALIYNLPEQIIAGEEIQEITIDACEPVAPILHYEWDVQPFNPNSECADIAPNFGQGQLHVFEKPSTTMAVIFERPGHGLSCSYKVTLAVTDGNGLQLISTPRIIEVPGSSVIDSEGINLTFKLDGKVPEGQEPVEFYPGDMFDLSLNVEWNNVSEENCTTIYGLWIGFGLPQNFIDNILAGIIHPNAPYIFFTEGGESLWFLSAYEEIGTIFEHPFESENYFKGKDLSNPYQNTFNLSKFQVESGILQGKYSFFASILFQNENGVPCFKANDPSGQDMIEVYMHE